MPAVFRKIPFLSGRPGQLRLFQFPVTVQLFKIIPAHIGGDSQKIALQIPLPVTVHVTDEPDKRFLGAVAGIRRISCLIAAETVDIVIVFFRNLSKRLIISLMYFPDPFFVVHEEAPL